MNSTTPKSIQIDGASKTRLCVNGDPDNVIELNTSDLNVVMRYKKALPQIQKLGEEALQIKADLKFDDIDEDGFDEFFEKLNECDAKMKALVNEVFDSDVADKCAAGGTMFDPVNGELRAVVIMTSLMAAYNEGLEKEVDKSVKSGKKHTAKYTAKKK